MTDYYLFVGHQAYSNQELLKLTLILDQLSENQAFGWRLVHSANPDLVLRNAGSAELANDEHNALTIDFALSGSPTTDLDNLSYLMAQASISLSKMHAICSLGRLLKARHSQGFDTRGVDHLVLNGQLVAVISFHTDLIGWLLFNSAADFEHADWQSKPLAASMPESFFSMSIRQLMWLYAQRSTHNLLPERYRSNRIRLLGAPKIPNVNMSDEELFLFSLLSNKSYTLEQLYSRCDSEVQRIDNALAGLLFAGAISSYVFKPSISQRVRAMLTGQDPLDPNDSEH